jgi:hypothetical protein
VVLRHRRRATARLTDAMRRSLLGVIVLAIAGCASSPAPIIVYVTPAATERLPASPAAVTVKGAKSSKTEPFHLAGSYLVTWTATPDGAIGCVQGGFLKPVDGSHYFEDLGSGVLPDASAGIGTTHLYNVPDAKYFVEGTSGCASWTYTFTSP